MFPYFVLLTGSRSWMNENIIEEKIRRLKDLHGENLWIIHGACRGADLTAQYICIKLQINYMGIPAKWLEFGKAAGPIRNKEMLCLPFLNGVDEVIAFPENLATSKGTKDMIRQANKAGVKVTVYFLDGTYKVINPKQLELGI